MTHKPHPVVLIILDGFGYREDSRDNAINSAYKPNWDALWTHYPHTLLQGSGCEVGLPAGQMGNSEVGHLNLGAGRVVKQELTRIDDAIASGELAHNAIMRAAIAYAKQHQSQVHVLGLLSEGGVHSHQSHIFAALTALAQAGVSQLFLHAILDGRDTPPNSAAVNLQSAEAKIRELGHGQIASIIGRFYAMDRDNRWERIAAAYNLYAEGQAPYQALSSEAALKAAYARGESDEFVQATQIVPPHTKPVKLQPHDVLLFMNFRADRARELSYALCAENFQGFARLQPTPPLKLVTLTQYATDLKADIIFPPNSVRHTLGEWLAKHNLKQFRIAETEKYAHVTYFFNGGIEVPFLGETRLLIPSPKVKTYDLQPEMSAPLVTKELISAMASEQYALLVCNFANADMVGHTGNFAATKCAIEAIDVALGDIITAAKQHGIDVLITADHGNAEKMYDLATEQAHTAHTTEPVPCLYVGRQAHFIEKLTDASLADVAPTILMLMGLPIPAEMTGRILLTQVTS